MKKSEQRQQNVKYVKHLERRCAAYSHKQLRSKREVEGENANGNFAPYSAFLRVALQPHLQGNLLDALQDEHAHRADEGVS